MYAIVDIAGQQFKVEKNNKLFVHRLEDKEGSTVSFDKVLLIDKDGKVSVGAPVVDGATVVAKVVSHLKGDKVLVFKKKRRKGYQVLNGHRQFYTELVIEDILEKGQKPKAASKTTDKKEEPAKNVEKEDTTETAMATSPSKEPVAPATKKEEKQDTNKEEKKSAAKKPAAKKTTPKKTETKKAAPKKAEAKTEKKAAPKADKDKEESESKE